MPLGWLTTDWQAERIPNHPTPLGEAAVDAEPGDRCADVNVDESADFGDSNGDPVDDSDYEVTNARRQVILWTSSPPPPSTAGSSQCPPA